jgi:Protein of unknown function (DUF3040)
MSSPENDQRVLDAIENQLRIENPRLVDCFCDLGSKTPWIKQADNPGHPAPVQQGAPGGRHRKTEARGGAFAGQLFLVIIVPALSAVLVAGVAWWLLTAFIR